MCDKILEIKLGTSRLFTCLFTRFSRLTRLNLRVFGADKKYGTKSPIVCPKKITVSTDAACIAPISAIPASDTSSTRESFSAESRVEEPAAAEPLEDRVAVAAVPFNAELLDAVSVKTVPNECETPNTNENECAIQYNDIENMPTVKYNDNDTAQNKTMATQISKSPATEPLDEDLSSIKNGHLKITLGEHYIKDKRKGSRTSTILKDDVTFPVIHPLDINIDQDVYSVVVTLEITVTTLTGRTVILLREMRISDRRTKLAPISANPGGIRINIHIPHL